MSSASSASMMAKAASAKVRQQWAKEHRKESKEQERFAASLGNQDYSSQLTEPIPENKEISNVSRKQLTQQVQTTSTKEIFLDTSQSISSSNIPSIPSFSQEPKAAEPKLEVKSLPSIAVSQQQQSDGLPSKIDLEISSNQNNSARYGVRGMSRSLMDRFSGLTSLRHTSGDIDRERTRNLSGDSTSSVTSVTSESDRMCDISQLPKTKKSPPVTAPKVEEFTLPIDTSVTIPDV